MRCRIAVRHRLRRGGRSGAGYCLPLKLVQVGSERLVPIKLGLAKIARNDKKGKRDAPGLLRYEEFYRISVTL